MATDVGGRAQAIGRMVQSCVNIYDPSWSQREVWEASSSKEEGRVPLAPDLTG